MLAGRATPILISDSLHGCPSYEPNNPPDEPAGLQECCVAFSGERNDPPGEPGRYCARFPTPASGEYHLEITQQKDGQTLYRQSRGLTVGYNSELRLRPTDEDLLQSIAEVTGGRHQPTPAECFTPWDRIAHRPEPIWPWLIAAAAMLLVLDVALRRVEMWRPSPVA